MKRSDDLCPRTGAAGRSAKSRKEPLVAQSQRSRRTRLVIEPAWVSRRLCETYQLADLKRGTATSTSTMSGTTGFPLALGPDSLH